MSTIARLLIVLAAAPGCTAAVLPDDPAQGDPRVAPVISITPPTNGLPVSRTIEVSATAAQTGGIIESVTFDLPGISITDTTPPFQTMWDTTTVADGNYDLRAVAIDDRGVTGEASARVVVANAPCVPGTFTAALPAPADIPRDGLALSLPVAGDGIVTSLSLSLAITGAFRRDLQIALRSPGGTSVALANDDSAIIRIKGQVIQGFDGQRVAGSWQLVIRDRVPGGISDAGSLDAWSLTILGSCNAAGR
jgi:hypothetical protein